MYVSFSSASSMWMSLLDKLGYTDPLVKSYMSYNGRPNGLYLSVRIN